MLPEAFSSSAGPVKGIQAAFLAWDPSVGRRSPSKGHRVLVPRNSQCIKGCCCRVRAGVHPRYDAQWGITLPPTTQRLQEGGPIKAPNTRPDLVGCVWIWNLWCRGSSVRALVIVDEPMAPMAFSSLYRPKALIWEQTLTKVPISWAEPDRRLLPACSRGIYLPPRVADARH